MKGPKTELTISNTTDNQILKSIFYDGYKETNQQTNGLNFH